MATLSVSPADNPVAFVPSGVRETRPVTVVWDTELLSSGRLSRRVDGGGDEPFGAGRTGSAVTEVALNQTQTFTLRSGVGQVLATLVLTTVLETAPVALAPTQRIDVSRAVVGADSVHLRWSTALPVACWAEITAPGRRPGFAGTDRGTVHQARFDGLDQDADYTVRLLAEGAAGRYLGAVHTGHRPSGGRSASREVAGRWMPDPEVFRRLRLRGVVDVGQSGVVADRSGSAPTPAGPVELHLSADGELRVAGTSGAAAGQVVGGPLRPGFHLCPVGSGVLLVGVTTDGQLVSCLLDAGRDDCTWRRLGVHEPRSVATAPCPGGVQVVVVTHDGGVRSRVVSDAVAEDSWESIGEGAASVAVAAYGGVEPAVVVATPDGAVRLRNRSADGAWGAWIGLGSVEPGRHAVHWESEHCLAVTTVDDDHAVHVLTRPRSPGPGHRTAWVSVGTLSALEQ